MNMYVAIIRETVDYIESAINAPLTVAELSAQAGISDYHFNRMFSTVTGVTLKQYVLGRKLAVAVEALENTNRSVIDIALDLGFEYPEVFSRAFKKQFGISPALFRKNKPPVNGVPKACIVERDISNYRGVLALKGSNVLMDAMKLQGITLDARVDTQRDKDTLAKETGEFLKERIAESDYPLHHVYTIVQCSGCDDGNYKVFCGFEGSDGDVQGKLTNYDIPPGWYASFVYHGDMFTISEAFTADLYRWLIVNEAEICNNGIGMLNRYPIDYPCNDKVDILIPIKKPI